MIPSWMTNQLARSHDQSIARLIDDPKHCASVGRSSSYSRVLDWIPTDVNTSVLELGCGPGRYVALLGRLGCSVTGVDPSRFPSWQLISQIKGVEFYSDVRAEALPFADGTFDAAVCIGAILYFDSVELGLSELRRVLKPGSHVVVRNVNRNNRFTMRTGLPLDPASKNLYTMRELMSLMETSGFKVAENFSHGYFPSRLRNLWWYASNVILPKWVLEGLSSRTPRDQHVNNTLFLVRA